MNFDFFNKQFSSERNVVMATGGMVATTQPLASQAGARMLEKGGNAIDAIIAAATSLTVLEPTSNGIGGDCFALIYFEGKLYGLNASGPASRNISIDKMKKLGYNSMPDYGPTVVNIPGAPKGWAQLNNRFAKLSLLENMQPAIDYARYGYPVSPLVSKNWKLAFERLLKEENQEDFQELYKEFSIEGNPPEPGQIFKSENMARSLEEIGETKAQSFYTGDLSKKLVEFMESKQAFIDKADLEDYKAEWVQPISVNYKGYDIYELPPNTHGIVVLNALKIFENLKADNQLDYYHNMIESMKLAYSDGLHYITDQNELDPNFYQLISDQYTRERSSLVKDSSSLPTRGALNNGGTVYLAAADEDGNMVSLIQSNFMDFGSGLVLPDTGINLHNRGRTFSLDNRDYNCLGPSKKTYHTIIPGFIMKDNKPLGPFGVMGKYMQPQGHFQLVSNLIDLDLDPQQALDKYRWQWIKDREIWVEEEFPKELVEGLRAKGHKVVLKDSSSFGRGQLIIKQDQVYFGGTEKRADGHIAVI